MHGTFVLGAPNSKRSSRAQPGRLLLWFGFGTFRREVDQRGSYIDRHSRAPGMVGVGSTELARWSNDGPLSFGVVGVGIRRAGPVDKNETGMVQYLRGGLYGKPLHWHWCIAIL